MDSIALKLPTTAAEANAFMAAIDSDLNCPIMPKTGIKEEENGVAVKDKEDKNDSESGIVPTVQYTLLQQLALVFFQLVSNESI